ncbi:glycosyltransferase [Hoylesella loescheii]|jgi:glycosyl transferase group 1 protein|uniref:glycosyltransferase n=1 Tax=Hoylesella loescheii TaxID=840 RepID=UPI0028E8595C|nr:glycosyltransferase [Hoylesella loescheii]
MKHNDKHILHVVNIYFVIPYFLGGQFEYFRELGYELDVVCSASPYLAPYARQHNFGYREIPILRSINPIQDFKSIRQICRYIKDRQVGIVVGHTPKGGLLSMVAAWLMRVPKRVYFRHGLVYQTSSGLKRFILMSVDRLASLLATKIVCVSPSVLEQSIKDKLSSAHKQIVLGKGTCSGVDTQGKFNPQNINPEKMSLLKQKWGIDDSDWIVGYTGRLVRDKGIMELVDAFDLVKANNPRLKLLLVGMFEERDALPQEVQNRIKNDPQIVWTDFQNEDMEYFYAMMNVYVLMSYREGFPTGTLEAQSMGVPVVTTRVTGCCDSIVEGETGTFVSREPEELGKVIKAMSEGEITFSAERTRLWVIDNFDNLRVWEEIKKLYEPTTIEG